MATEVPSVTNSADYTWTLKLYEERGNAWVEFRTTSPFRAQQGQIHLYSGTPGDPTNSVSWTHDDQWDGNWDTGKVWGSGWSAGWIAQASPNGPFVSFCTTDVT